MTSAPPNISATRERLKRALDARPDLATPGQSWWRFKRAFRRVRAAQRTLKSARSVAEAHYVAQAKEIESALRRIQRLLRFTLWRLRWKYVGLWIWRHWLWLTFWMLLGAVLWNLAGIIAFASDAIGGVWSWIQTFQPDRQP